MAAMRTFCRSVRYKTSPKSHSFLYQGDLTQWQHRSASTRPATSSEYCVDLVRKFDYENFLCTLLLPQQSRTACFAIRAFNVELAQIRDIVSDRKIGQMRMQFWRETLEHIFKGAPPEQPVAKELAKAIQQHKLSKQWFVRVIDAREDNLSDRAFMNLKAAEDYAEKCVSSVNYLTLETLGIRDVNADHAASHIGRSQGLVNMLRAVPFHGSRQRCYLPTEILMLHGVSDEDVIRGCQEQRMKDVVFDIAANANQHLETARSMKSTVPKNAYSSFLQTVICDAYLKILQRTNFDVFDKRLQLRNNWLPISLWMQKLKKTY